MSALIRDLKHTVWQLRRRPVFTLTAVLTLAIGMGVNAVASRSSTGSSSRDQPSAPETTCIATTPGGDEEGLASLAEYQRFADATRGALDLAAEGRHTMALRREGIAQTAWVLFVSSNPA